MAAFLLFLVAFALFGLGWLLKRRTSPYTRVGGDAYTRRRKRKLIADIVLIAAGIVLAMALLSAFVPTGP